MTIEWFESTALRERYARITLPGRPEIYVFPKDMSNTYALVGVRFGSADVRFVPSGGAEFVRVPYGTAHFLEHRMFADEDGGDATEKFAALGADSNAYTSFDSTVYMINTTERFGEAYAELLRMVGRPNFTAESVARERGIIAQEIRMYDDDPEDVCYQNLTGAMYAGHPIGVNVCGDEESIARITSETLYLCHKSFYIPAETVTVVCGRVEPREVAEIVGREISDTASPRGVRYRHDLPASGGTSRRVTAYRQVSKPVFAVGIRDDPLAPDPRLRQRRRLLISVLNRLIFASSGELYNSLYDDGLLTSSLAYGYEDGDNFSFVTVSGSSDSPDEVYARICGYITRLREGGLDPRDFERCRRARYADIIGRYDTTEDIANSLAACAFHGTDIFTDGDVLASLTPGEGNALLRELYEPERFTLSLVLPRRVTGDNNTERIEK